MHFEKVLTEQRGKGLILFTDPVKRCLRTVLRQLFDRQDGRKTDAQKADQQTELQLPPDPFHWHSLPEMPRGEKPAMPATHNLNTEPAPDNWTDPSNNPHHRAEKKRN